MWKDEHYSSDNNNDNDDDDDDDEGDLDDQIVYLMNEVKNQERNAHQLNSDGKSLRMEHERLEIELQQAHSTILSLLGRTTVASTKQTTVDDNVGGGVDYGDRNSNSLQLLSEQLSAFSSQQRSILNLAIQERFLPTAILPSSRNHNTTTSRYDDPRSTSESSSLSLQSLSIGDNGNEQQHLHGQQQMTTTSITTTDSNSGICPRPLLHELFTQAIIADNEHPEVVEATTKTTIENNIKHQR